MSSLHADIPDSLRRAAQDVHTRRGQADELLQLLATSLTPMLLIDNQRRYVEVNAAARLLFRLPLAEMRRRRADDLTPAWEWPAMESAWNELLAKGTLSGRYNVALPDRSQLWVFFAALANVLPGLHLAVFVPADWPGDELPQPAESADDRGARRRLSPRQLEVLRFLAAGASLPQIAEELSLSETTVKTHARDALRRLGAKNRAHAVALAISAGLLRAHR